jgi:hypothetical protein
MGSFASKRGNHNRFCESKGYSSLRADAVDEVPTGTSLASEFSLLLQEARAKPWSRDWVAEFIDRIRIGNVDETSLSSDINDLQEIIKGGLPTWNLRAATVIHINQILLSEGQKRNVNSQTIESNRFFDVLQKADEKLWARKWVYKFVERVRNTMQFEDWSKADAAENGDLVAEQLETLRNSMNELRSIAVCTGGMHLFSL